MLNASFSFQNEYLPLLRLTDPTLLLSHLQNLFPAYLTNPPTQNATIAGASISYPSLDQWEEVIPASNEAWFENVGKAQPPDKTGWRGKERGRRLTFMYLMLLKNQGIL